MRSSRPRELCRVYGYCLPGDRTTAILATPFDEPDAFVDAVLLAEGLDPYLVDRLALRRRSRAWNEVGPARFTTPG